jgi:glycerol uptake facilitator protein
MELTLFHKCVFEFIGTMVMILLGDGVCASNTLNKSKGKDGGWVVITLAWGFAVMCGVFIAGPYSGAHLNPAVTLGLALAGKFAWAYVPGYIAAQMLGGFCGAFLVYIFYRDHFKATSDNQESFITIFCTMPAIKHKSSNLFSEFLATAVLVFVILALSTSGNGVTLNGFSGMMGTTVSTGSLGGFPVTALIMAIGMSLGGTTGYAMNPARDLGPRCVHAILFKTDSGWDYSWIPVAGPLLGATLAAAAFLAIF